NMLRAFGRAEVTAMLEDTDPIEVSCQFCHRLYRFDESDIERLFSHRSPALH
ncbi:MAG: Hsp33 family molecular chaperone HslO, partial [Porticoccaceae bacterium]|nr:Hsp33 family molecular chaperone HslO [Porticoccaceae bacterium]